jgi:hypothetical protein
MVKPLNKKGVTRLQPISPDPAGRVVTFTLKSPLKKVWQKISIQ